MLLPVPEGARFGKWVVLREVEKRGITRRFLCRCDCGMERSVTLGAMRNGQSRSCGKCSRHGGAKTTGVKRGGRQFGDILNELLAKRGETASDVAVRLGRTPSQIYNLLYGLSNPVPLAIERIVAVLKADDREAYRLHLAAARDRGYRI